MQRVLVVDDDVELCELLAQYLKAEGFDLEAVANGEQGVGRALSGDHALVVLDVMLPAMQGFEVLRQIRAQSPIPVLMLTARGDDLDRILGLELGADDYLPKPFNPRELAARIRAILRRAKPQPSELAPQLPEPMQLSGSERFWALSGSGPSGRVYVLVLAAELPLGGLMALRFEPVVAPVPLLTVLIMAGVLCFWLARHITTPVSRVRTATQQLADGNLGARVGRAVASRHDELADLGRHVDRMAERLESLLTSQRLLFRNVSHELRSPLARLNVALELARQCAPAEVPGYLDRIAREAERLNRLIGQMLTLARLESGVDPAQQGVFELGGLVQEVVVDGDFEA